MTHSHTPRPGRGDPPGPHLTDWTLEQIAEGVLPAGELDGATDHLAGCDRCAAELEAHRSLFTALSSLPRFEPSAAFNDAVIARVRVAPAPAPVWVWLRELLPHTRRGWVLLAIVGMLPVLPFLVAAAWLLTHPLVTPDTLTGLVALELSAALGAVGGWLERLAADTGIAGAAGPGVRALSDAPADALLALAALLTLAVPVSLWALVRLARTPRRTINYANRPL